MQAPYRKRQRQIETRAVLALTFRAQWKNKRAAWAESFGGTPEASFIKSPEMRGLGV